MKAVWAELVPVPKKALTTHLTAVLAHLKAGLTDRLWRAREASCLALADLLPGREWDELKDSLEALTTALMRALDDIKETVRVAALTCWRALCSVCTRLCSAGGGGGATTSRGAGGGGAASARAAEALDLLLPLLLERGVGHAAEDVSKLCAKQLLKLCEAAAPPLLAPHTGRLVPRLLENLSVLEDQSLNYLQMHAASAGISDASLEQARVAAVRSSASSTALETCLGAMGAAEISDVLPSVGGLLTRGVGLPTRTGAARFLMLLAQRDRSLLAPHAPKLLRTLQAAVLAEASVTARRAYAAAASEVARAAPSEALSRLSSELCARYVDEAGAATEEELRLTVATLLRELLRGASDAMATVRSDWLPLAFVGRHEPRWEAETVNVSATEAKQPGKLATVWREAYDEAGGSAGVAALHLPELLGLTARVIDGTSWSLRRAAAAALAELLAAAPTALTSSDAHKSELRRQASLLRERKMWEKETLVAALDAAIEKCIGPDPTAAAPAAAPAAPASGDW